MRISTTLLAAGFAASALAAPQRRSCKSKGPAPSASTSGSAPAAVVSSSSTAPSSTSAVYSSAAAVATTAAAANNAASSSSAPSSSTSSAASTAASSSSSSSGSGFKFLGASESGAEFGQTSIPGAYNTDFIFPDTSAIQTLIDMGMNAFRLPFLMERMAQGTMTATLDADYLANLTTVVDYITQAGAYAVLDPHNYARYDSSIISSTSDFTTFWTNMATPFASNSKVIFDCNNEPHDMSTNTQTAELMQACIDGIRNGAGATTQYIFVEGTSYTGAWTWTTSGNSEYMGNITDTVDDLLVYEMHQYLDSDGSGTSETCVSTTIGAERVKDATTWLRDNGKMGIIGEFAGGVNSDCETAVDGMLSYLEDNSDVWLGALWWGAGPWWGDYIYSLEPPSGVAYVAYKDILSKYVPS